MKIRELIIKETHLKTLVLIALTYQKDRSIMPLKWSRHNDIF